MSEDTYAEAVRLIRELTPEEREKFKAIVLALGEPECEQ